MIHIKRNRCGYAGTDGYTCVGAPTLSAMFVGNGITCDNDYYRDADDDWEIDFEPALPLATMESFLAPYGLANDLWQMPKAETQERYDQLAADYQSHVWQAFRDTQTPEAEFGRALADWLLHMFVGTVLSNDPHEVQGVDPASVQPTLNTSYAYMQDQINALEYSETVQPFQHYVDKYMHGGSYMDNYLNLPAEFRGQVTAWSPVPDMGQAETDAEEDVTAPEEECRDNFDAGTAAGFLDLLNKVYTKFNNTGVAVSSKVTARSNSDGGPTSYVQIVNHLICFSNRRFEPGFIEPMLPVKQPVPPVLTVTQTDSGIDGAMLAIANITSWKNIVNMWLDDIGRSLMHIWGLRSLLVSMMKNQLGSTTFDFTISTTSDDVLTWDTESGTTSNPSFTVGGGTMYVNGQAVSVSALASGISASSVPVHIWLNVTLSNCDNTTGQYGSVSAALGTSAATGNDRFAISIGGIRKITLSTSNGVPGYTLYQILQERHFVSIELVRVCKAGVLYRFTSGASPYRVLATTTCD